MPNQVVGFDHWRRQLHRLEERTQQNVLAQAIRQGSKAYLFDLERAAPVRSKQGLVKRRGTRTSYRAAGFLKRKGLHAFKVRKARLSSDRQGKVWRVSPKAAAFYAWILSGGGENAGRWVNWIGRQLNYSQQNAFQVMRRTFSRRMEREIRKLNGQTNRGRL